LLCFQNDDFFLGTEVKFLGRVFFEEKNVEREIVGFWWKIWDLEGKF